MNDKFSDSDQRYKKLVAELVQREMKGETIDYEKESVDFWNNELKRLNRKKKHDTPKL